MKHLLNFAEFLAQASVPDDVLNKTALILCDSIGAIVGGAEELEVRSLTEKFSSRSHGPAIIIGSKSLTDIKVAAFLNGTAGTTLEMDEGNQFCKGHPAMHVIPAALAEASVQKVSGKKLLTAITLGYEAAARVGIATSLRPSMHPHGTWGAIGAAVAVMHLRDANETQIYEVMNIAANLGLTTSRKTMLEGGTVRNVFAGISNKMGLIAADLVQVGYSGDRNGVGHVFGSVASDSFDDSALSDQLGERWEVMRNYFKMHSCCRYNHAALDVIEALQVKHPSMSTSEIKKVEVFTYGLAVELNDPAPRNVLAAKFSVPFAVATTLINGSSGVDSFTIDKVGDELITSLASKVRVFEDKVMSAQLPNKRPAKVKVYLKDERILEASTETNRGDWADPYSIEDIKSKYHSLTKRSWSLEQSDDVWSAIMRLEKVEDLSELFDAL